MLLKSPNKRLIGHRGAARIAPENTMPSIEAAFEADLDWVEFDVQPTKDLTWISLHDSTLDRTTTGNSTPLNYSYNDLSKLDAGSWFDASFTGTRIPTMLEILTFCLDRNMCCNIEIKTEAAPFIDNFFTTLYQFMNTRKNADDEFSQILISSFNLEIITTLRQKSHQLLLGYIVDKLTAQDFKLAQKYECTALVCNHEHLSFSDITKGSNLDINIGCYTCNNPVKAKQLIERGIWGIYTDNPYLLDN